MEDDKNTLDELYQAYLAAVYEKVCFEDRLSCVSGNLTYGEMFYPSVKQLIKKIDFSSAPIFLDLGSGLGKFILQVFMQTTSSKVIGIEFRRELSEQSSEAIRFIHEAFPFFWENGRQLKVVEGDFLKKDWEHANIVYACSTCFHSDLLAAIGERINKEFSVKQVFSLRPLPTLERLSLKEVFTVECSWDSTLCYHYTLSSSTIT